MKKVKNFFSELVAVITLISGAVTVLAGIALFFKVPDATLILLFSVPTFVVCALLLTFVIKDGWSRFFGEAFSGIFQWPF